MRESHDRRQADRGRCVGTVDTVLSPRAALVGQHLYGVRAWVDAEQLSLGEDASAGFDYLRHRSWSCLVI